MVSMAMLARARMRVEHQRRKWRFLKAGREES